MRHGPPYVSYARLRKMKRSVIKVLSRAIALWDQLGVKKRLKNYSCVLQALVDNVVRSIRVDKLNDSDLPRIVIYV